MNFKSNDDTDNGLWAARLAAAVEQMSFGSKTITLNLMMMKLMMMTMMMRELMKMTMMVVLIMMIKILTNS